MFFQKVSSVFLLLKNDIPRVIVNNAGRILKRNKIFRNEISDSSSKLSSLMTIHTNNINRKDIKGVTQSNIWSLFSKRIFNVFQISFVDIAMIQGWIDFPFSISWIDASMHILKCNNTFEEEFNYEEGDNIITILPGLNVEILKRESVVQFKIDKEYYRIFINKYQNDVFMLVFENISETHSMQKKIEDDKQIVNIGHATSAVIHDFRNILTVISGYCDFGLKGNTIYSLGKINDACQNAQNLVEDLLSIIRNRDQYSRMCNPSSLIDSIRSKLKQITNDNIVIRMPNYTDIAYVPMSDTSIERIITNIVLNAREASYNSSNPSIELKFNKILFKKTWEHLGCQMTRGWYIKLSCIDYGAGIEGNIDDVFRPFNSNKANGNGIGLSSALSVLRDSGGGIQIFSRQGKTRVDMYLPIVQQIQSKIHDKEKDNQKPKTHIKHRLSQDKNRILIVEDNEDVLKLCSVALRQEGYETVEACNAEDALRIHKDGAIFDLLITDLNMPGIDGLSMINRMDVLPKNVLVISGYDKSMLAKHEIDFPINVDFMLKPIKLLDLKAKVHNIFVNE